MTDEASAKLIADGLRRIFEDEARGPSRRVFDMPIPVDESLKPNEVRIDGVIYTGNVAASDDRLKYLTPQQLEDLNEATQELGRQMLAKFETDLRRQQRDAFSRAYTNGVPVDAASRFEILREPMRTTTDWVGPSGWRYNFKIRP